MFGRVLEPLISKVIQWEQKKRKKTRENEELIDSTFVTLDCVYCNANKQKQESGELMASAIIYF